MICNAAVQARIQGGGQGGLAPPPHFLGGGTRGPKTTHTEKKIKIGRPRSKIQAKTYPKNTLNTLKFSLKKSCEVGGGLRGHKGKWKKKSQKYNIIQMLKSTLFSHIFKHFPFKMYLPCGVSPSLLFHQKIFLPLL